MKPTALQVNIHQDTGKIKMLAVNRISQASVSHTMALKIEAGHYY